MQQLIGTSRAERPILSLANFEGPLDLLLALIEQQHLDITAIALAEVADQYLAALHGAERVHPATLAEFVAIGARLLVIKTRALLPRTPSSTLRLEEEDPGEELARQLKEYSQFKVVATTLGARDAAGLRSYIRAVLPAAPAVPVPEERPALDITVDKLVALLERRLRLLASEQQPAIVLPRPKLLTIAEVTTELRSRLTSRPWITFDDLLSLAVTRAEVIVTLWTVLELYKRDVITIEQQTLFEFITLGRGPAFTAGETSRNDTDLV